jgi:hypothetical protein
VGLAAHAAAVEAARVLLGVADDLIPTGMGLFGGMKLTCGNCDKKIKESKSVFRRQLRFCSQACVDAFVAAHPIAPIHSANPRLDAANRLIAALGELASVGSAGPGVSYTIGATTLTVTAGSGRGFGGDEAAVQMMRDALYRFDQHVLEALPYIYAVPDPQSALALEMIDLEGVRNSLPSSAGLLGGVSNKVHGVMRELSS